MKKARTFCAFLARPPLWFLIRNHVSNIKKKLLKVGGFVIQSLSLYGGIVLELCIGMIVRGVRLPVWFIATLLIAYCKGQHHFPKLHLTKPDDVIWESEPLRLPISSGALSKGLRISSGATNETQLFPRRVCDVASFSPNTRREKSGARARTHLSTLWALAEQGPLGQALNSSAKVKRPHSNQRHTLKNRPKHFL